MLRDGRGIEEGYSPSGPSLARENVIEVDDATLVAASQRGDETAFERLVERHQGAIYRLCFRYARNHADAADLAQDAFLRAHRGLPRFRGESSFATWLFRIATNVARSHVSRRRESVPLSEVDWVTEPRSVERIERDRQMQRVRRAVAQLPEKQRATLVLKIYQELTHDEVAKALGTSVGTAKANLFHALANLRKMLRETGGES